MKGRAGLIGLALATTMLAGCAQAAEPWEKDFPAGTRARIDAMTEQRDCDRLQTMFDANMTDEAETNPDWAMDLLKGEWDGKILGYLAHAEAVAGCHDN